MGIGGGYEYDAQKSGTQVPEFDLLWPGYFDAYVWKVPADEGYASWNELNADALRLRLEHFARDPGYALEFFGRKLAIEWLRPNMEGFIVSNYDGRPEGDFLTRLADDHRQFTRLAWSCYYGRAHTVLSYLSDLAQSLIAVGAFAWCVYAWRRRNDILPQELLAITYVLGAALLYVFWENKTQYILPYYVFLVPYAACGWNWLLEKAARVLGGRAR